MQGVASISMRVQVFLVQCKPAPMPATGHRDVWRVLGLAMGALIRRWEHWMCVRGRNCSMIPQVMIRSLRGTGKLTVQDDETCARYTNRGAWQGVRELRISSHFVSL